MDFYKMLKELQEAEILQTCGFDDFEDIPLELYDDFCKDAEIIKYGLNIDEHRHYELSTIVLKIEDRFLGARIISKIYSEMGDFESCYHTLEFFEMKEVKEVTYTKKD